MAICEVCDKETERCPSSPFTPCSYWKCEECSKASRIALWEFLCILNGNGSYGDNESFDFDSRCKQLNELLGTVRVPNYGEKFLLPTLKFYGMTKEEAYSKREDWKAYCRDRNGNKI